MPEKFIRLTTKRSAAVLVAAIFFFLSHVLFATPGEREKLGPHLPAGVERPEITDQKVIEVMSHISRRDFVPGMLRGMANRDAPLPIGEGQTISQPFIVAYMSQETQVQPGDRVLEVGTGSGYQAAVLERLGAEVYTIEIVESLADSARKRLKDLGYSQIFVRHGDGYKGWPEKAPFQAIVITAAAPKIPEPLWKQLAVGGRMVLPLKDESGREWMTVVTRGEGGQQLLERKFQVRFVPMTGDVRNEQEKPVASGALN